METDKMNDTDPFAIHVMQTVIGSTSARFHLIFLKSLIWHHFEKNGTNAAPIHLHLLTDKSTRYIVESILESWRIKELHYSFYSAETYQAWIGWMKSYHRATKFATLKIYTPEILSSTVSKVIQLDTDCLFMADVVHLWSHFDYFDPHQFLAMSPEPFNVYYDLTRVGGGKQSFSYNGGVILWYLQRVTMAKWDIIWKPSYLRAVRTFKRLPAAEQTLLTVTVMDNPEIFYRLSCLWNFQINNMVIPDRCPSTWSRPGGPNVLDPFLVHFDRRSKLETSFSLVEPKTLAKNAKDLVDRYVVARSRFTQLDGYIFRHAPLDSPTFSFSKYMKSLHPEGKIMNRVTLCRSKWFGLNISCNTSEALSFTSEHRIHPLLVSHNHEVLINNEPDVTLAISLNVKDMFGLVNLAAQWTGWMSVALYGTDEEALSLLVFLEKSEILKKRKNLLVHYVYKSELYPESTTLHNVAVLYSPTQNVIVTSHNYEFLKLLGRMVGKIVAKSDGECAVFATTSPELDCAGNRYGMRVVKPDAILTQQQEFKGKIKGVLLRTGSSLLPAELEKSDRATQLLALVANAAFK